MSASKKTIAMIVTSKDSMGPHTDLKSGFWFEELATPYYEFVKEGNNVEVIIASTQGGNPPADPLNLTENFISGNIKKFQADERAMNLLQNSVKVSDLDPSNLDAIFFVGGFATTYDFPESKDCIELVEAMAKAGKVTAAICGGVCALCNPKSSDGKPLLEGKKCVSLRDAEVEAVGLSGKLAFNPESKIVNDLKGDFQGKDPFGPNAVADGKIVTGQNYASSQATALLILEALA